MSSFLQVWILDEPWSFLQESGAIRIDDQILESTECEFEVSGKSLACVAVPPSVETVWYGAAHSPLPIVGDTMHQGEHLVIFGLPAGAVRAEFGEQDVLIHIGFRWENRDVGFLVMRRGCTSRPRQSIGTVGDVYSESASLQSFIDWQVGSFQELLDLEFTCSSDTTVSSQTNVGVVRRGWGISRAVWYRTDVVHDDPARMALVVRIARERRLMSLLDSICSAPRVILQRYRDKEKISRIQELDSTCLRWFAKQPGRTVIEKSGPSQRLLAVKRRESIDTLENRVLCWVLHCLVMMGQRYLGQNQAYSRTSVRCRDVRKLVRWAENWLKHPAFKALSIQLPQPVQPNYPLQQHSKYKRVWTLYKRLVRNQRVEDDAWKWQHFLWKESCHQMLGAYLTQDKVWDSPNQWQSSVYIRDEIRMGRWLCGEKSPGPFLSKSHTLVLADPSDSRTLDIFQPWLKSFVADLALVRMVGEVIDKVTIVWFVQSWNSGSAHASMVSRAAQALRKGQRSLAGTVPVDGLLIVNGRTQQASEVDVEEKDLGNGHGVLTTLSIPPDAHRYSEDVKAGYELMLGRLLQAEGGP